MVTKSSSTTEEGKGEERREEERRERIAEERGGEERRQQEGKERRLYTFHCNMVFFTVVRFSAHTLVNVLTLWFRFCKISYYFNIA